MNYEKRNERIEYIDCFRAFGIILMVMGHIGFGISIQSLVPHK